MIHLGDITKIDGTLIAPVDCITGGSPCQDLSVAGKRAGLAGERSGLFIEQIRIVKEMREADVLRGRSGSFIRPRFMVWENVPGAFSSNGGKDFAAVLEEILKVVQPNAHVDVPEKRWKHSGCIVTEDGRASVAWRLHDAQFWGVPQRRKRIALVADFGGLSAPEILFERKGLSGNPEQSGAKRESVAGGSADCAGKPVSVIPLNTMLDTRDKALGERTGLGVGNEGDAQFTLTAAHCHAVAYNIGGYNSAAWMDGKPDTGVYQTECTRTLDAINCGYPGCNQGGTAVVYDARGNGNGEIVPTITGDHENRITDYTAVCIGNGQTNQSIDTVAGALNCMHDQQAVCCFQNTSFGGWNESDTAATIRTPCGGDAVKANLVAVVDCRNGTENSEVNGTLQAKEQGQNLNSNNVCRIGSLVRRLTPTECCRLQGYPDGWCDIGDWYDTKGKLHKESDSVKYKAFGNSIALPFWFWLLRRISAQYERPATMGSLFDGIGGFPLCWERCNGKGTALWASEIEEFPIAVTKYHFPENEL